MKVDFGTKILDARGNVIKNAFGRNDMLDALAKYGIAPERQEAALAVLAQFSALGEHRTEDLCAHHLVANALQFVASDERIDGAKKTRWMKLAFKVMDEQQPVEINAEEKDLILQRVDKAYSQSVLFYARMEELFLNAEITEQGACK